MTRSRRGAGPGTLLVAFLAGLLTFGVVPAGASALTIAALDLPTAVALADAVVLARGLWDAGPLPEESPSERERARLLTIGFSEADIAQQESLLGSMPVLERPFVADRVLKGDVPEGIIYVRHTQYGLMMGDDHSDPMVQTPPLGPCVLFLGEQSPGRYYVTSVYRLEGGMASVVGLSQIRSADHSPDRRKLDDLLGQIETHRMDGFPWGARPDEATVVLPGTTRVPNDLPMLCDWADAIVVGTKGEEVSSTAGRTIGDDERRRLLGAGLSATQVDQLQGIYERCVFTTSRLQVKRSLKGDVSRGSMTVTTIRWGDKAKGHWYGREGFAQLLPRRDQVVFLKKGVGGGLEVRLVYEIVGELAIAHFPDGNTDQRPLADLLEAIREAGR